MRSPRVRARARSASARSLCCRAGTTARSPRRPTVPTVPADRARAACPPSVAVAVLVGLYEEPEKPSNAIECVSCRTANAACPQARPANGPACQWPARRRIRLAHTDALPRAARARAQRAHSWRWRLCHGARPTSHPPPNVSPPSLTPPTRSHQDDPHPHTRPHPSPSPSFIKMTLGAPSGVDVDALKAENEQLRSKCDDLELKLAEAEKKLAEAAPPE